LCFLSVPHLCSSPLLTPLFSMVSSPIPLRLLLWFPPHPKPFFSFFPSTPSGIWSFFPSQNDFFLANLLCSDYFSVLMVAPCSLFAFRVSHVFLRLFSFFLFGVPPRTVFFSPNVRVFPSGLFLIAARHSGPSFSLR